MSKPTPASSQVFELLKIDSPAVDVASLSGTLEQLAQVLRTEARYHELFDVLLLQARLKLGLPATLAFNFSLDQLDEPLRTEVEKSYLAACNEIGYLLLDIGQIGEAWRYLRPTGESAAFAEKILQIEPNDHNVDQMIDICLRDGVAPVHGLKLMLQHYGTCNTITAFESEMHQHRLSDRQAAAALMVKHLHAELLQNVRHDIQQKSGLAPQETTLLGLIAERDWLFSDHNYHIDTTHLASVLRFARIVETPETIALALDMTEYGLRLSSSYHLPGDAPFTETHPHHRLFFAAQLGQLVDEALQHFQQQAETANLHSEGPQAAETYVVLLVRLGRLEQALEASMRLLPDGQRSGFAPSLIELAQKAGQFDRFMELCRNRGDIIAYTRAWLEKSLSQTENPA